MNEGPEGGRSHLNISYIIAGLFVIGLLTIGN